MTERLADISARIDGIRQLGAVVNAMRGIAAARAQQARSQLVAVDTYAATIAVAIGRALALVPSVRPAEARQSPRMALVLFCAEQGFAGAFSERVLDAVGADLANAELFLIGTRGSAVATERGVFAGWKSSIPSHSLGVPKLADRIAEALYWRIGTGEIDRLDVAFSRWQPGQGTRVERRRLFPLDMSTFPRPTDVNAPLLNLEPKALLSELIAAYMHAQLCNAALHAFTAENQARMEAMASARNQIERQLSVLRATQWLVRQEEITAEVIELAAGETAGRFSLTREPSSGTQGEPPSAPFAGSDERSALMMRYILIPATGHATDGPVFETALAVAQTFASHLAFLHVRVDVTASIAALANSDAFAGGGLADLADVMEREATSREQAAVQGFRDFCTREQLPISDKPVTSAVSAEWHTETGETSRCLVEHGRIADLLVIGRNGDKYVALDDLEAALLGTGRPVLLAAARVPQAMFATVTIAWKNTPEAARGGERSAVHREGGPCGHLDGRGGFGRCRPLSRAAPACAALAQSEYCSATLAAGPASASRDPTGACDQGRIGAAGDGWLQPQPSARDSLRRIYSPRAQGG